MKYRLSAIALSLTAVLAHAGPVPAGWKVVKDNGKGKCEMAVPADWKEQDILGKRLGMAKSPDGKVDAVINMMDGTAWKDFKGIVFQVYAKEKDAPKIQDTGERLWFEITSMGAPRNQTQWYVATPAGKGDSCNAQVNFPKGNKQAEELARKVVETIKGG